MRWKFQLCRAGSSLRDRVLPSRPSALIWGNCSRMSPLKLPRACGLEAWERSWQTVGGRGTRAGGGGQTASLCLALSMHLSAVCLSEYLCIYHLSIYYLSVYHLLLIYLLFSIICLLPIIYHLSSIINLSIYYLSFYHRSAFLISSIFFVVILLGRVGYVCACG